MIGTDRDTTSMQGQKYLSGKINSCHSSKLRFRSGESPDRSSPVASYTCRELIARSTTSCTHQRAIRPIREFGSHRRNKFRGLRIRSEHESIDIGAVQAHSSATLAVLHHVHTMHR